MKVKCINTTNLEILYNFVKIMETQEKAGYPTNINQILKRVIIDIEFEEMNPFEVLALKALSSSCRILSDEQTSLDGAVKCMKSLGYDPDDDKMYNFLQSASYMLKTPELIATTNRDAAVYRKQANPFVPICFRSISCKATFTGSMIMSFYQMSFNKIFDWKDASKSLEENIEDNLIAGIVTAIFKKEQDGFAKRDVLSDIWLGQNVYSYIPSDKESVQLIRIFGENGYEVRFVDSNPDEIYQKLSDYNTKFFISEEDNPPFVELACTMAFTDFMTIMLYQYDNYVVDHENYFDVMKRKIPFDLFGYGDLLKESCQKFTEFHNYMVNFNTDERKYTKSLIMDHYMIPSNQMIKFTLIAPLFTYGDDMYKYSISVGNLIDDPLASKVASKAFREMRTVSVELKKLMDKYFD